MLIFAHRGASGTEPENTLRAIKAALDMYVDGIEIDIFEADNTLFVLHDRWLHRTTTGVGQIYQHKRDYLRSLDAGLGEKIPTLNEVLSLVNGQCVLNIELKGIENINLLLSSIDNALNNTALTVDGILLSSFNHPLLQTIHQQRPEFAIGALTASCPLDYANFAEQLNAYSVHIDIDFINQAFVDDAHQRGLKVLVYTVNELDDMKAMQNLGVDGVFTNYPTRLTSLEEITHE